MDAVKNAVKKYHHIEIISKIGQKNGKRAPNLSIRCSFLAESQGFELCLVNFLHLLSSEKIHFLQNSMFYATSLPLNFAWSDRRCCQGCCQRCGQSSVILPIHQLPKNLTYQKIYLILPFHLNHCAICMSLWFG